MFRMNEKLSEAERAAIIECAKSELGNQLGSRWMDTYQSTRLNPIEAEIKTVSIKVDDQGNTIDMEAIETCALFEAFNRERIREGDTEIQDVDYGTLKTLVKWASRPYQTEKRNHKHKEVLSDYDFQAMVGVSWRNNRGSMFGAIGHHHNTASIEISDASVINNPMRDHSGVEMEVNEETSTIEVELTPEHYIRLIRSENTEVPCTLSRFAGYIIDQPPEGQEEEDVLIDEYQQTIEDIMKPVRAHTSAVIEALRDPKGITSKKKLNELIELVTQTLTAIDQVQWQVEDEQVANRGRINENIKQRFLDMVNQDIKSLPEDRQKEAYRAVEFMLENKSQ